MKLKLIKTHNVIIAILLSILGFSTACKKEENTMAAYGSPHAFFKINGKVTSEEGEKIPAIMVIMSAGISQESDTIISDYDGNYEVKVMDFPYYFNDMPLKFEDIDGEVHGSFQAKDTIIKFKDPIYENGHGWYKGEASKEVNIKLKKEGEL